MRSVLRLLFTVPSRIWLATALGVFALLLGVVTLGVSLVHGWPLSTSAKLAISLVVSAVAHFVADLVHNWHKRVEHTREGED